MSDIARWQRLWSGLPAVSGRLVLFCDWPNPTRSVSFQRHFDTLLFLMCECLQQIIWRLCDVDILLLLLKEKI